MPGEAPPISPSRGPSSDPAGSTPDPKIAGSTPDLKIAGSTPDPEPPTARARAVLAIGGGVALIAGIVGVVALASRAQRTSEAAARAQQAAAIAASAQSNSVDAADQADAAPSGQDQPEAPARPAPWRVSQLAGDANVSMIDVTVGRRPLLAALGASGLTRGEAQRVARALEEARDVDHPAPKDTLHIAYDTASRRAIAFEYASSPSEVWQARESDGKLAARKLDLDVESVHVRKGVTVGADLRQSLAEAGLAPVDDLLSLLDDALEGHAELSDIREGARLRVVATEELVSGAAAGWSSLDAVEYFPAAPSAAAVRVYLFAEGATKRHGWYDARARQPYHGGWRTPVPLARVASRFNPHRMHPVLHVVMPHNGVDFAAPIGAPVYATAAGVVAGVGNDGPCGNKVEVAHPGGITSVYCHLSRFAPGLHAGQHVETRQLIAYVGQTGRVTGPHLHFGIRRGGVFVDPMTLRLDGVRVVPRAARAEFERRRAALDEDLDAIALAPASAGEPSAHPPTAESPQESFYEEPP